MESFRNLGGDLATYRTMEAERSQIGKGHMKREVRVCMGKKWVCLKVQQVLQGYNVWIHLRP